jgi:hypothetical protein
MDASAIIDTLTPLVPGATFEAARSVDFATLYVPADRLVETCRALRDHDALQFNTIIEIRGSRSSTTCCRSRAGCGCG